MASAHDGVDLQGVPSDKVDAILAHHNKATGKEWKVTMVQGSEQKEAGALEVSLVLCSGDLCSMETFVVAADGAVTKKKGGFF